MGLCSVAVAYTNFMLLLNLNPKCSRQAKYPRDITGARNSQMQFGKYNLTSEIGVLPIFPKINNTLMQIFFKPNSHEK